MNIVTCGGPAEPQTTLCPGTTDAATTSYYLFAKPPELTGKDTAQHFAIVLDDDIKAFPQIDPTDPTLSEGIAGGGEITGATLAEAKGLALVLRSGRCLRPSRLSPSSRSDETGSGLPPEAVSPAGEPQHEVQRHDGHDEPEELFETALRKGSPAHLQRVIRRRRQECESIQQQESPTVWRGTPVLPPANRPDRANATLWRNGRSGQGRRQFGQRQPLTSSIGMSSTPNQLRQFVHSILTPGCRCSDSHCGFSFCPRLSLVGATWTSPAAGRT